MTSLREFDVIKPPTSILVQKLAREALELKAPDHKDGHEVKDRSMTISVLGRYSVPRPEPEDYTFVIYRATYGDEGSRIISGAPSEGQFVTIHTSGDPEQPASATIVG